MLCAAAAACTSGPNSIHGTVGGQTIDIADAVSAVVTMTQDIPPTTWGVVVMGSSHTLCTDFGALVTHPNEQFIIISLADVSGMSYSPPTEPGTFMVRYDTTVPPQLAYFQVLVHDAMCNDILMPTALGAGGTVVLTGVDGDRLAGHYDVTLGSGDHVTGSFDPEPCPALGANWNMAPTSCH
jgi:hypothetical protein